MSDNFEETIFNNAVEWFQENPALASFLFMVICALLGIGLFLM